MTSRDIWITGVGAVSPGGKSADETWQTVVDGRSAIRPVQRFPLYEAGARVAGSVPGYETESAETRSLSLEYGRMAASEALRNAGLSAEEEAIDLVVVGTLGERQIWPPSQSGEIISGQELARRLAVHVGADAGTAIFGACAAGGLAIASAVELLRSGAANVVLAGGVDCLLRDWDFFQYCNLYALSTRVCEPEEASCPFDNRRDGFVMGEGAGFLVLETPDHGNGRGVKARAVIEGIGYSQNAYHPVASPPDAEGPSLAIDRALQDARLEPQHIDYINAHGTSTRDNDWCETLAVKQALGPDAARVPISSTKSEIGHAASAAGAIEAVLCVRALETGLIPPTINLDEPDPNCDLDYVPWNAREARLRHVLTNSFGFGGHNSSLVLGRAS